MNNQAHLAMFVCPLGAPTWILSLYLLSPYCARSSLVRGYPCLCPVGALAHDASRTGADESFLLTPYVGARSYDASCTAPRGAEAWVAPVKRRKERRPGILSRA